tara:strand:- start:1038 stop:1319 length:282 start_codon:yes stop_codon:yes gene_type:complete
MDKNIKLPGAPEEFTQFALEFADKNFFTVYADAHESDDLDAEFLAYEELETWFAYVKKNHPEYYTERKEKHNGGTYLACFVAGVKIFSIMAED